LDTDVNASAPIMPKSPAQASTRDNVQDGITPIAPVTLKPQPGDATQPPAASPADAQPQQPLPQQAAPQQADVQSPPPEPVSLDHPTVLDTSKLKAGDTTVTLYGIEGVQGQAAQGLQGFLETTDHHMNCQAESAAGFVCLLSDGTDVAQVALVNGAARTKDDAPPAYKEQEAAAQAARRGIWANLPPPPVELKHPIVQDTATLMGPDNQPYVLDGLQGLGAPYTSQLQGYIAGNGDSVTCHPKGMVGSYICVTADGTDLAKIVLVNGAAVVAPDAPDSYRVQQGDALSHSRGIWVNPPPDLLIATAVSPDAAEYVLVAGDDGADGITYVGGEPMVLIDGVPEFLVYGDGLGWGYYDGYHHWRGAPDRYRNHMDRFHAGGSGLRGYGHDVALRREAVLQRGAAAGHPGAAGGFHSAALGAGVHNGAVGAAGVHPGAAGQGGFHPGAAGQGGFHPGAVGGAGVHPGGAGGLGGGHPSFGGGGGFARPNPMASAGGFHPGGGAVGHASAPAPHGGGGGGGGGGAKHK
jgi:endonuclease YncB( thermonuclease family)